MFSNQFEAAANPCLDALGILSLKESSSEVEPSDNGKPPIPRTIVRRESRQPSVDLDNIEPPQVATSKELETISPTGGRFVSNTYSYATIDNPDTPVNNNQKVYKCEDEP